MYHVAAAAAAAGHAPFPPFASQYALLAGNPAASTDHTAFLNAMNAHQQAMSKYFPYIEGFYISEYFIYQYFLK